MVKVKEGYVMNAREKAEFDRVNALPRKASGTVAYYFKPQTKYPPRIYVFMHAEIWCDRNRRPMGLHTAFPFLTRTMNREEIEYHHFDTRLCYHQYEDWGKLLYAEEKEAQELDKEQAGSGKKFIHKLRSFQSCYPLSTAQPHQSHTADIPTESEEDVYLKTLLTKKDLPASKVVALLNEEQQGKKRLPVFILLREMYKASAGETNRLNTFTLQAISRLAERSQNRSRRKFVRRIYKANPLFAIAEIRACYPDYTDNQLAADLKRRPAKIKRKKQKPVTDLRRCQLRKLAAKLMRSETDDPTYHQTCIRMAILEEAHRKRLPIPIPVKLSGVTKVYYFNWKTREEMVKCFVEKANGKEIDHLTLDAVYKKIIGSNYSF